MVELTCSDRCSSGGKEKVGKKKKKSLPNKASEGSGGRKN